MNIKNNLSNINPIVKVVSLLLLTVFSAFSATLLAKFFMMLISVVLLFFSNENFKFKKLKNMFVVVLIACVSNVFYSKGSTIFKFGFINITDNSLLNFLSTFLSMSTLWLNSLVMIKSVSPSDIPIIAEFFFSPMRKFNVDVSEISMIMSLVMRFIPIVLKESKKVILAQESRGAKILHGPLFSRIKYILPVFIPILISCFRKAINIATAMECRCYGAPFEKTSLKENKITKNDIFAIIAIVLVFSGVLVCNTVKTFCLF